MLFCAKPVELNCLREADIAVLSLMICADLFLIEYLLSGNSIPVINFCLPVVKEVH